MDYSGFYEEFSIDLEIIFISKYIDYELQKTANMELIKRIGGDTRKVSLALPRFEVYEEGQQIRKPVKLNIVEGYRRRRYKEEYIRFIILSLTSNDDAIGHPEALFEAGSLKNQLKYQK